MSARQQSLDGIRGLAILFVLLFHLFPFPDAGWLSSLAGRVFGMGWLGVDLFFVLSGYLITGILLRERDSPRYFQRFYLRRTLRIFPPYYAVLLLTVFLVPHFDATLAATAPASWSWPYFFYLSNMMGVSSGWPWHGLDHYWSLAIEEQFYLLWPFLVLKLAPHRLGQLCVAVIGLAILAKIFLALRDAWGWAYLATPCRMDALAVGSWLALQQKLAPEKIRLLLRLGALAALALLAFALWRGGLYIMVTTNVVVATSLSALMFGALVAHWGVLGAGPAWLTQSWLLWLGRRSYSLYIVHWVLFNILRDELPQFIVLDPMSPLQVLLMGLFALLLTLLSGEALWHLVENPCLRLKDRATDWLNARPLATAQP